MVKNAQVTHFMVEPTEYGWAVRVGSARLALFMSQRQAIADVKRRQKGLRAEGGNSDVTVVGQESEAPRSRLQPFFKRR
jgi:hypothetical protein